MNKVFSSLDLPVGIEEPGDRRGEADGLRWENPVPHHDHRKSGGGRAGSGPPCHLQAVPLRTVLGQDDHTPGMPLPLLHSSKSSLMLSSWAWENTEGENRERTGSASVAFWDAGVCDNRPLCGRALPSLGQSPSTV